MNAEDALRERMAAAAKREVAAQNRRFSMGCEGNRIEMRKGNKVHQISPIDRIGPYMRSFRQMYVEGYEIEAIMERFGLQRVQVHEVARSQNLKLRTMDNRPHAKS